MIRYEDMRSTLFEIFRTKYGAESIFVGMHFRVTNDGQSILNSKMIQKLVKTAVKKISETAEKTGKISLTILYKVHYSGHNNRCHLYLAVLL